MASCMECQAQGSVTDMCAVVVAPYLAVAWLAGTCAETQALGLIMMIGLIMTIMP